MNARLVKITSKDEAAFIREDLGVNSQNTAYWIGLHEKESNDEWKWSDGSELDVFIDWNTGEPNIWSIACAVLFDGKWRDRSCSDKYNFICEKWLQPRELQCSLYLYGLLKVQCGMQLET